MVPPRVSGRAVDVKPSGSYTVVEPIAYVDDGEIKPLTTALSFNLA